MVGKRYEANLLQLLSLFLLSILFPVAFIFHLFLNVFLGLIDDDADSNSVMSTSVNRFPID